MVLFININIGQRVEVLLDGGIYRGTVQFKGCIVTKKGEWVGISLDDPVGDTCGMLLGRRYFQARDGHGIFVRATKIRFIPNGRRLFNRYHRVVDFEPAVDDSLFHTEQPPVQDGPYDPIQLTLEDFSRVKRSLDFSIHNVFPAYPTSQNYSLRHSVGNTIPAATMRRPATSMSSCRYLSRPMNTFYKVEDDFIPRPSIPKTHMPFVALRRQVARGWDNSHYVREMSVPTGRERMKMSQWNDISD